MYKRQVQGDPENVDAQYRTEKSVEALKAAGVEVEELVKMRGDWDQTKGQEITANALSQHGAKIDVVFCNNDAMALGALQAIEAAGRKVNEDIYLVGVDALVECVENVMNGKMTGTVFNDHFGQAQTAADMALAFVNGEEVANVNMVDLSLIHIYFSFCSSICFKEDSNGTERLANRSPLKTNG